MTMPGRLAKSDPEQPDNQPDRGESLYRYVALHTIDSAGYLMETKGRIKVGVAEEIRSVIESPETAAGPYQVVFVVARIGDLPYVGVKRSISSAEARRLSKLIGGDL